MTRTVPEHLMRAADDAVTFNGGLPESVHDLACFFEWFQAAMSDYTPVPTSMPNGAPTSE